MPKQIYLILLLVFYSFLLKAQEETDISKSENQFSHLVSSDDVVHQLRKNYGIYGSVLLSKSLTKILNSFSNQQQAVQTWQTTINELTDTNSRLQSARVNSQFHSGQLLSQYTHGMTPKTWNNNQSTINLNKQNLTDFINTSDDLTLYFHLPQIWEILLQNIATHENIQWHEVFNKSLTLFPNTIEDEKIPDTSNESGFFDALNEWQKNNYEEKLLTEVMSSIENSDSIQKNNYQNIIRFLLEKNNKNYLSTAMTWLSIANHLHLNKSLLSDVELTSVVQFIEESDTWFLTKEQELLAINRDLPNQIESSFHQLKRFYNSDNTNQDFTLANIYQLLQKRLNNYMTLPFRNTIHQGFEVCFNISRDSTPLPQEPIDKKQFLGCIKDLTKAATEEAKTSELSGSLTKIKSQAALDRALQSPAWQTINLMYANVSKDNCLKGSEKLVNPLEWTIAAESMLWFVNRWPNHLLLYPQNNEISAIIKQGEKLTQHFNCLEKSKEETLDNYFNQIVKEWQNVKNQIKKVTIEFNESNLAIGSDINLIEHKEQSSNYRVADIKILACDAQKSCGIHTELEPTRALFGLFPNHLLLADQLKLGSLKLCYDNVGWENRHAVSTHLDNDSVANYLGNFSFSLKGFYNDQLVFSKKLIDKEEYLYLFAANTREVLQTSCPLDIIGTKISTKLKRGTYGLVPNRLTFLTASRADETSILVGNWEKGAEWNNAITHDDITLTDKNYLDELKASINQYFQQKATQLQTTIYRSILNIQPNPTNEQQQLAGNFASMQRAVKLFYNLNYILQMNELMLDDNLHGLFFGDNKIPDAQSINDLYKNQLNISSLIENIESNLKTNQEKWNALEKSWSNLHIKDILFRLNNIN